QHVRSWDEFLNTRLPLDPEAIVSVADRARLEALPASVHLLGDRLPLEYEVEPGGGGGVVRVRLKEGQARRLRPGDLPEPDRPSGDGIVQRGPGVVRRLRPARVRQRRGTPGGRDRS